MTLSLTQDSVTLAEADAYAASRGRSSWVNAPSSPPEAKEAAIRRATDYMAGTYNQRWTVAFEPDAAPEAVKYAICEAAIRELAKPGSLKPDYTPAERVISKTVDVISKTFADVKSPDAMLPVFSAIEGLLVGYIASAGPALFGRAVRS